MPDYVDARELLAEYKREDCPRCGERRWFKHAEPGYGEPPYWNCLSCRRRLDRIIWVACPDCDRRMVFDDGWTCRLCGAERGADRSELIDRMSDDYRRGYIEGGEPCPICGERFAVWADPDGDAICRENEDFFAGQYGDEWYAYAEWLTHRGPGGRHEAPTWIRVNEDAR